jgi:hypothetical protein
MHKTDIPTAISERTAQKTWETRHLTNLLVSMVYYKESITLFTFT